MKLKPTVFDVNEVVLSSIFTFEQMIEKKHLDIRGLEEGKVMVEVDLAGEKLIATSSDAKVECSFSLNPFDKKLIGAGGWLAFADSNY